MKEGPSPGSGAHWALWPQLALKEFKGSPEWGLGGGTGASSGSKSLWSEVNSRLDYPGGPHTITRVLIRGRHATLLAFRMKGPQAKECRHPHNSGQPGGPLLRAAVC